MNNIRVGSSLTLSGKYGIQGRGSFNGLLLWVEKINRSGGLLLEKDAERFPIEFIHYDDKSDPKNTSLITKKLIVEDKVDILLGPYSSTLTIAAAEMSERYDRVLWNHGGSSDEITNRQFKKVVSAIAPASRYFEPFLNFIGQRDKNVKAVAIVSAENSGFSTSAAEGAVGICKRLGISHETFKYKSGSENFTEIARQIRMKNIKYVLGMGRFEDDLRFAKHLKGYCSCLVAAGIEEFKNRLQKDAEGFFSVTQWEPIVEHKIDFGVTSEKFKHLYKNKFQQTPDYVSAQPFNMGTILENFITETGSVDEEVLMKKVVNSRFCTFYGNFEIEQRSGSQIGHKTLLTQWQNGIKEIVHPAEQQTAEVILF